MAGNLFRLFRIGLMEPFGIDPQRDQVRNVSFRRADVQDGNAQGQNVVNFARMDNAYKWPPRDNDVQVCRAERTRELLDGLIRQALDVGEAVFLREGLYFWMLAAATDKAKNDLRARGERERGFENWPQRMARTVVSRIHNDELVGKTVFGAESVPPCLLEADCHFVRPGRNDLYRVGPGTPLQRAHPHETVKDYDPGGMPERVFQHPEKDPGQGRIFLQPPGGDRLIRIHVQHPVDQPSSFQPDEQRCEKTDQGGRRQRDYYIVSRETHQTPRQADKKNREIDRPPPTGALTQISGGNAANSDASPRLSPRKSDRWVVICPVAGDGMNLVAFAGQMDREVGGMLARRHDIGMEYLI